MSAATVLDPRLHGDDGAGAVYYLVQSAILGGCPLQFLVLSVILGGGLCSSTQLDYFFRNLS